LPKNRNTNCKQRKAAQNTYKKADCKMSDVGEIDTWSQFNQHFICAFFGQKQIEQLSVVTFQLLYFWRQNIGAQCACKMLMKFTPIVD